jgi:drug/metabolite transporter (DMT)-like permease
LKGFWLVQASNICFAVGQLLYRSALAKAKPTTDARVFFWLYLGAVAALIPFAVGNTPEVALQPVQWGALIYLGVIASGLSFFLWNLGARKTNAGTLAVMNNLKIPLAAIISLTVFSEAIQWSTMLSGILIFVFAIVLQLKISD